MDSICKNLLMTYNTNMLDDLSSREKKLWEKIVVDIIENKKYSDKNYKKNLVQLIYNHFKTQNKPNKKYISGPSNCTYWKIRNKKIYVFGEYHGIKDNCIDKKTNPEKTIDIVSYFKQLFTNTDVFIDFYLEIKGFFITNYSDLMLKSPSNGKYINNLRKEFMSCIQTLTRNKEECKLTRMHYNDIRQSNLYKNDFFYFINVLLNVGVKKEIYLEKRTMNWIKYIGETNIKIFKKYIFNVYEKITEKALDKSYYKEKINLFIKDKLKKYIDKNFSLLKIYSLYVYKEKLDTKVCLNRLNHIFIVSLTIAALMMDSYTLARIFRPFNLSKYSRGPLGSTGTIDEPKEPMNIIIYVGDAHADIYRKFFEHIGGEQIEISGTIYEEMPATLPRCLNMTGIKQPLFSDK